MCDLNSPDDQIEPTVTALDLDDSLQDLCRAATAYTDLLKRAGVNSETSAQLRAAGIDNPNGRRIALMNAITAYMATGRNVLADTSGTYASAPDLAQAQDACLRHNNQSSNRTAMRRAEALEAADAPLILAQQSRGADLAATLPTYVATPRSVPAHGDYERYFHPSSAA